MAKDEEIVIKVEKGKINKLKKLGISAQEVFSKGLYDLLKERYEEYITSDDELDEFVEDGNFKDFADSRDKFEKIIVSDSDIDNN